jgi:hypothetical protein
MQNQAIDSYNKTTRFISLVETTLERCLAIVRSCKKQFMIEDAVIAPNENMPIVYTMDASGKKLERKHMLKLTAYEAVSYF